MAELKVSKNNYDLWDDKNLLFAISCKDEDEAEAKKAFGVFYKRHIQWLYNLCCQICSTVEGFDIDALIEDICQNTMLKVWKVANNYNEDISSPSTWVSRIAKTVFIDTLREYKGTVIGDLQVIPLNDFSSDVCDDHDYSEIMTPERQILELALLSLSDKERNILMTYMRYNDGAKHLPENELQDLRSTYETTSDNLKHIKNRALKKVKNYIDSNINIK